MKFGNEFLLILFREYISPNLFAVCVGEESSVLEKEVLCRRRKFCVGKGSPVSESGSVT